MLCWQVKRSATSLTQSLISPGFSSSLGHSPLTSLQLSFNWLLFLVHPLSCPLAWMSTHFLPWEVTFSSQVSILCRLLAGKSASILHWNWRWPRGLSCYSSLYSTILPNMTDGTGKSIRWSPFSSTANDFSVLLPHYPSQLSLWVRNLSGFFILHPYL